MPCAYMYPEVMNIHSSKVMEFVCNYNDNPIIFCGDFNICPNTSEYNNLTKNNLVSAYKELNRQEPDFTCRCYNTLSNRLFENTIDYIFYSKEKMDIVEVRSLPNKDLDKSIKLVGNRIKEEQYDESLYPNKDEPSDHLLLYADFKFKD